MSNTIMPNNYSIEVRGVAKRSYGDSYYISYSKSNEYSVKISHTINDFNEDVCKISYKSNYQNISVTALEIIVGSWVHRVFSSIKIPEENKIQHRCDRFLEEVFELLQVLNYPKERIDLIKTFVYNRPVGELEQEVGGVQTTLCALTNCVNVSLEKCVMDEIVRIFKPEVIEKVRQKEANKLKELV